MKSTTVLLLLVLSYSFLGCVSSDKTMKPVDTEQTPPVEASVLSPEESSRLQKAEMDVALIERMVEAIEDDTYPNIHSVLIAKGGEPAFEHYFRGPDQNWGTDIGVINHSKGTLHDMRSISKSIVSACVGIAIEQGLIDSVGQKVFEFFPEFQMYNTEAKSDITLEHMLTMTAGLKWNENLSYDDPENSEIRMINSPDPVEYVLSRPMDHAPGEQWKYSGGATQVLASIIEKTSGMRLDEYANTYLFEPLDIDIFEWITFPGTEVPAAASGLRLRSTDLLKIGLMYGNNGNWEGTRILEEGWIEKTFKSYIQRPNGGTYGYQFWLWTENLSGKEVDLDVGVGNGDQRLFIDRENGITVVVTAGNYNRFLQKNALALLRDFIYPSIF